MFSLDGECKKKLSAQMLLRLITHSRLVKWKNMYVECVGGMEILIGNGEYLA